MFLAALEEVVEMDGRNILTSPRLTNILSDFNAFKGEPSIRKVLELMISEGMMTRLINSPEQLER